jgi:hypothetical protein
MTRLLGAAVTVLALLPAIAQGEQADPRSWHWRDIANHCADACDPNFYKCPCMKYHLLWE